MSPLQLVQEHAAGTPDWEFVVDECRVRWDWGVGDPPLERLVPTRRVRSGALSRHVPVLASCQTTETVLALESGLELELLLWLDRQPEVVHLVPQPVVLRWGEHARHTPDLLAQAGDGGVTLWDVRALEQQDDAFLSIGEATATACAEVGWTYRQFSGLSSTARLNLRWLAGARRPPEWLASSIQQLREMTSRPCTVGEIVTADDGRGYLLSSMWHLAWRGSIHIDLNERWGTSTALTWAKTAS